MFIEPLFHPDNLFNLRYNSQLDYITVQNCIHIRYSGFFIFTFSGGPFHDGMTI